MSPRRSTTRALAVGLSVAALTGCGFRGASSIPLPGGEGQGDDAYKVTIEFQDVLDLVPQSAVKVDDVTVGSVESIEVTGYTARVVVRVNPEVALPANSTASLRQTSLLGEKFVSMDAPPAGQATGRLRGGETIGLERTSASAEIEEVLGALSLVLNGGSLEQLQTINREIVEALEGREDRVKSVLGELDLFVGGLDDQKEQIVRALDSLDRLSARLVGEREVIATALEEIPAGVEVLTDQREDLTAMLVSLDELGDVAVRVIDASQESTTASLQALQPILGKLAEAGDSLPQALEILTTYPFPRTVTDGVKGDYANLFVTADLDLRQILEAEGVPPLPEIPVPVPQVPLPPVPTVPPLPVPVPPADVPDLPELPDLPLDAPDTGPGLPEVLRDIPLLDRGSGGLLRLLMGGLR